MSKFVNIITTILGLLLIPYAAFLIYSVERFTAMDFLILSVAGFFLIWFKDSSARDFMEKVLKTRGDSFNNESNHSNRGYSRNGNLYEENNNEV
jgi:hypothetical protein